MNTNTKIQTPEPATGAGPNCAESTGSALWAQFASAALVGHMASISLHDQPHLWMPMQCELAAKMADQMMGEHAKRFPSVLPIWDLPNTAGQPRDTTP